MNLTSVVTTDDFKKTCIQKFAKISLETVHRTGAWTGQFKPVYDFPEKEYSPNPRWSNHVLGSGLFNPAFGGSQL